MPLLIEAQLIVEKIKSDNPKAYREEQFTDQEVDEVTRDLLNFSTDVLVNPETASYYLSVHSIDFVHPVKDLKTIQVPLAELRQAIASQMTKGSKVMDLESLLYLVRTVYRENRD